MSARHLACIIGWPVAHSLSPAIHNAAFEALGLDWTYIAIAVRPGAGVEGVGLLRTLGADGANVTMPHKRAVVPALDALDGDAERVGAVNTIVREGDRLIGRNTDGEGFLAFLRAEGLDPAGGSVLLLGAGGAARAVALSLSRAGAIVHVASRRAEQAAEVATLGDGIEPASWSAPPQADLVVNATPLREGLPVSPGALGRARGVVDMIYAGEPTEIVRLAEAAGVPAHRGLGMLVHQAALAFEAWTGCPAPLMVMAEAARGASPAAGYPGVRSGPEGRSAT